MQYFALNKQARASQYMKGQPNSIYTEVFPNQDFAASGYWFWLKSVGAHGFDVKAFDQTNVYIRIDRVDVERQHDLQEIQPRLADRSPLSCTWRGGCRDPNREYGVSVLRILQFVQTQQAGERDDYS